jgi:hypothetical protein
MDRRVMTLRRIVHRTRMFAPAGAAGEIGPQWPEPGQYMAPLPGSTLRRLR